ncbi:MAG: protocatechuate 3,4-dioxygenase subunit alpha [Rhodospirillales bacterium]
MKLIPTGSQTVGPYFAVGLARPEWSDLTRYGASGEKIRIAGRVLDGDGAPINDAMLEIWQANAAGKYNHPDDTQDKKADPKFLGFGRACTDNEGRYRITTVKPGPVPGRGNTLQAPHINVAVFARGVLKQLVTRIYFADEAQANDADPVLGAISDKKARATLLARPGRGKNDIAIYRFDVILQGKGETAFFDI